MTEERRLRVRAAPETLVAPFAGGASRADPLYHTAAQQQEDPKGPLAGLGAARATHWHTSPAPRHSRG